MEHGNGAFDTPLHTLIPLADFKAILGIDDRDDSLSRYCLTTATYTIKQYCKRRLIHKKHTDYLTFSGDHIFTLREYPVRKVLAIHTAGLGAALRGLRHLSQTGEFIEPHAMPHLRKDTLTGSCAKVGRGEARFAPENLVDPKHYYCLPDEGIREDIPFSLVLRPPFRLTREEMGIRIRYLAGYSVGKAPADLASACLELAAWNMSRYRGRRIGMNPGGGKDGEHLETSIPENVRLLLEPYLRRVI
jgi:hypothetical protein